jgi:DNA-binding helix-hairpin-helix protein with protein kinase domain
MNLVDRRGCHIQLDRQLASGGEGIVYTLTSEPSQVAKVYRKPPSQQTVEKLARMVSLVNPALLNVATWPSSLLFDIGSRRLAGFTMPRLTGFEPIHHLYNPAQRLKYYPRAGWNFLIRTAYNCAAAFDEVHRTGCLVGDINQSNIQVSHHALVRLIDCDSFQVRVNGKSFLCEVGVPHYTPPELQGQAFRGLVRTENHDRFGLAVILFQLLFVGRHPYAGVYRGPGDIPFERAIQEFRFAYGPKASTYDFTQPPFTPGLADIPPELAHLFRRAFERGAERGTRPGASEWLSPLKKLGQQLATCIDDSGHYYWSQLPQCVWCRIVNQKGPDYFFGVTDDSTTFSLDEAWLRDVLRRLQAAHPSDFPYSRNSYQSPQPVEPEPLPDNLDTHKTLVYAVGASTVLGVLCILLGFISKALFLFGLCTTAVFGLWLLITVVYSPWAQEVRRRSENLLAARQALSSLEREWGRVVQDYQQKHFELAAQVQTFVAQCRDLPHQRDQELMQLTRDLERLALRQHLQSYFIADASIPQIGEGRKQTLAAYNILSAYDIDHAVIESIPGFGEGLIGNLVAWKAEVIRRFRFDPSKGVPEADLRALVAKYRKRQKTLFAAIDISLNTMDSLLPAIKESLKQLVPGLKTAVAEFQAATADWRLIEPMALQATDDLPVG